MSNGILDPKPFGIALLCVLFLIAPGARADTDNDDAQGAAEEVTDLGAGELPRLSRPFESLPNDSSIVLNGQLQFDDSNALLNLRVEDAQEVNATAAAIGNSVSIDVADDVYLDSIQEAQKETIARMDLTATDASGDLTGTAAAIGNSLSSSSEGVMESAIRQSNAGEMVSSTLNLIEASTSGGVAMTGAAIGNSASFDNKGASSMAGAQDNQAGVESSVYGTLIDAGETVSLTAAAMANSLSGTSTGNTEMATLQTNGGSLVRSDLTGSLSNIGGDVSLPGAAIGNSTSLTLTGEDLTVQSSPIQKNSAAVAASVVSEITVAGKVNATAAAIGNTISITNKLLVIP